MFANEDSPAFLVGAYQTAIAATKMVDRLTGAFRTGEGIAWHEHDHQLFHGIERFFRSSYVGNLVQSWIPALDGIEEKLKPVRMSRISAAAMALRRFCWRRPFRSRSS